MAIQDQMGLKGVGKELVSLSSYNSNPVFVVQPFC